MATPETRPAELANTWAETGTVADLGDIATGWPAGKPGRGRMNALFGWLMQGVRYFQHRGVPDYSSSCTYAVGDRAQGSDGKTYVCIQANTPSAAQDPTSQAAYWVRWGHTDDEAKAIVDTKLGTLSAAVSSGLTFTGGATADQTGSFNFPNTTFKLLTMRVALPLTSGTGSTVLTLSGAAAFNTAALVAIASNAATGSTLKAYIVRAAVTNNNIIAIIADCGNSADASTAINVDVVILGS